MFTENTIEYHSHYDIKPDIHNLHLAHLPDPQNRYTSIPIDIRTATKINVPIIRNQSGALLHPIQYNTELPEGKAVAVDITLRL